MFFGEKSYPDEPTRMFLSHIVRKIFLEDWMMKLAALVITFALWFGVTGLSTPTTTRISGIPLTLRFSNNMEVTNTPVQEVDIVISGDKRRISQVNKGDLVISVDLTDTPAGERLVPLTPENVAVTLPTGIRLEEIQPNKIAVRLEPVEEKEVDVRIETEGSVPDGYEVYAQSVLPAKVRVRGPASYIRSLTSVTADVIDLTGKTADFTAKQVPINVSDTKATPLETVVDVAFRIGEERVEKVFLSPVAGDAFKQAKVVLFGPRSLFEGVTPQDLLVENSRDDAGQTVFNVTLPPVLQGAVEVRAVTGY